ncbi:MAG TPA: STAS domain-containing protein [Bacteroidales bacterium]|nr:STAS domain-containing protein [Bacteroidales bacterium]
MVTVVKLENNIDQVTFAGIEKFNALVADDAREVLERLFDAPNARVVIDLSGISYIDSSGFGCFLNTMKTSRNNYGTLKICCIKSDVRALFTSLQLHTIFELHESLEDCIASFR